MILHRREFLSLAAAAVPGVSSGCALLLDVRHRRLLLAHGAAEASQWLAPPGSTLKPLSLWALLSSGKLKPDESYGCPGRLLLEGVNMSCSHPRLPFPIDPARAITYSCNCATAHFAQRFRGDELANSLAEFGCASPTRLLPRAENSGRLETRISGEAIQLQALGERGISVTPLELVFAYYRLAMLSSDPRFQPILDGLEGAVQVGTGQAARLPQISVAGKTGSVRMDSGLHAAWFAGFAPSRNPQVAVTVLTQGRSGAASSAPVAGALLRRYFAGSKL